MSGLRSGKCECSEEGSGGMARSDNEEWCGGELEGSGVKTEQGGERGPSASVENLNSILNEY